MTLTSSIPLPSLRWLLWADAVTCTAAALLMTVGASPLADATDLPVNLLRVAGLILLPYVAFLAMIATRQRIPTVGAAFVVGANLAWVAGSLVVLLVGHIAPNSVGIAFVLAQAAAVLLLAELQFMRLRAGA